MKRKIAVLAAFAMLWGATAAADGLDFLKPIWMQLTDGESSTAQIPENVEVTCADERLTVESFGVWMENDYTAEAHIYAVLRNNSRERLPIRSIRMDALDANGKSLHGENYVSHLPEVVEPNETMLVSEWMYDFVKDIGKVASIRISVETQSRVDEKWSRIDDVRAWMEGDYLCVQLTNTTDKTLFGAVCGATVSDENGQILDMMMLSTYETEDLGILPQSSVVWRKRIEDAATLKISGNDVCQAWGYTVKTIE